jgi:hypothetical protein
MSCDTGQRQRPERAVEAGGGLPPARRRAGRGRQESRGTAAGQPQRHQDPGSTHHRLRPGNQIAAASLAVLKIGEIGIQS